LLSNALWTLYAIKAQAWFSHASQLHRTYVASLSALGWTLLVAIVLVAAGLARSPLPFRSLGSGPSSSSSPSSPAVWVACYGTSAQPAGRGRGIALGQSGAFFAVLWSTAYGFVPNAYQIVGGLVALSGVVYMQWRKLSATAP